MTEEDTVIEKLFELLLKSTRGERDNVSYIYLAQFNEKIIPFCRRFYAVSDRVEVRVDLLRWVFKYAKQSDEAIDFAMEALRDRSTTVKMYACLVLGQGMNRRVLPPLNAMVGNVKAPMDGYIADTIRAIERRDYQQLTFAKSPGLMLIHAPEQPTTESVDQYIKKYNPGLIAPLEEILGSLYGRWQAK